MHIRPTVVPGEGFFLRPKNFSSLNIFWSTCRMTFIFSPLEQAMLGEHVRYLEHGYTMCRKFSRAMENQVFIEKMHFSKGLSRIFEDFKTPKNPILSLLSRYFLIYVSFDLHFFSTRASYVGTTFWIPWTWLYDM